MKMSRCLRSPLVAFLFVFTLLSQAGVAVAGRSGKGQDTVSKIVEINKQALAQIQAGKFDAARDALWGAIATLTDANMADHEIAARTHVHLAAVYMTGFNDRTKAIRQFVMALKINPNIKITPQIETAALDEAFDSARGQAGLGGQPKTAGAQPAAAGKTSAAPAADDQSTTAPASSSAGGKRLGRGKKFVDQEEPVPPARVPEPFYCPLPSEVPPKEDLMVRCVTQKQPRRASATVFYRESGTENFTPLPMIRSPKGWLSATVPGAAVTGSAFTYYLEAKIPGTKEPLTIGTADSPNLMPIIDGAAPVNNTALAMLLQGKDTSIRTAPAAEDNAPLDEINKQYQIDEELRRYHRRLPGALFFSFGGGSFGQVYNLSKHKPDSHERNYAGSETPAAGTPVEIDPGRLQGARFQLLGEVGYQWTDRFALSLQFRYENSPSTSNGWDNKATSAVPPPTSAWAIFQRAQYAFITWGNFQTFASEILGGGPRTFSGRIQASCNDHDPQREKGLLAPCTVGTDHSDTVSGGPVAFGLGVGMMYHLTRFLAIWVEAREALSFGPSLFLTDFNFGLSFAHKFERSSAPPPLPEGGGAWEKPEEAEKPPADDSPSD